MSTPVFVPHYRSDPLSSPSIPSGSVPAASRTRLMCRNDLCYHHLRRGGFRHGTFRRLHMSTRILSLAIGASLFCLVGCKTEKVYNNPAPAEHTTVIERPAPEHVESTTDQPKVENNIHVDR